MPILRGLYEKYMFTTDSLSCEKYDFTYLRMGACGGCHEKNDSEPKCLLEFHTAYTSENLVEF